METPKTLIFLDIDGVLAIYGKLQTDLMQNLNRFIEYAGVKNIDIIFNTAWNCHTLEVMKKMFEDAGFKYTQCLIGQTAGCNGGIQLVKEYLEKRDLLGTPFIVIDDSTKMKESWGRLAHCSTQKGFVENSLARAINIFDRGISNGFLESVHALINLDNEINRIANESPWLDDEYKQKYIDEIKVLSNNIEAMTDEDFLRAALLIK